MRLFKPFLLLLVLIGFLLPCKTFAQTDFVETAASETLAEYASGVALNVTHTETQELIGTTQKIQIKLTAGSMEGKTVTVENILSGQPEFDINVNTGDRLLVVIERIRNSDVPPRFYLSDRYRLPVIQILAGLLLLGILWVGRFPGLKSIVLITGSLWLAGNYLAPTVSAFSPSCGLLPAALILAVASFLFQATAPNIRAVFFSSFSGLCLTVLVFSIALTLAPISGIAHGNESTGTLPPLLTVLFAGTGLLFYLANDIIRAYAKHLANQQLPDFKSRFRYAYGLGQERLGPLLFSLFSLWLGFQLPQLITAGIEVPPEKFFNLESTVIAISAFFALGLGIAVTIPLTAAVSAWLLKK